MASPRDRCIKKLTMRVGEVLTVGKTRWQVERSSGVTSYLARAGSKGRKLYTPNPTEIDPRCCIEMREVFPGSGEIKRDVPPAAKGCLVSDDSVFAGARRRRSRRR